MTQRLRADLLELGEVCLATDHRRAAVRPEASASRGFDTPTKSYG
jgi:hypothetical protein